MKLITRKDSASNWTAEARVRKVYLKAEGDDVVCLRPRKGATLRSGIVPCPRPYGSGFSRPPLSVSNPTGTSEIPTGLLSSLSGSPSFDSSPSTRPCNLHDRALRHNTPITHALVPTLTACRLGLLPPSPSGRRPRLPQLQYPPFQPEKSTSRHPHRPRPRYPLQPSSIPVQRAHRIFLLHKHPL